tara:strand:- start:577 stop:2337 length:1761 start_codon:yes stop_codon:yes gene_type:complete
MSILDAQRYVENLTRKEVADALKKGHPLVPQFLLADRAKQFQENDELLKVLMEQDKGPNLPGGMRSITDNLRDYLERTLGKERQELSPVRAPQGTQMSQANMPGQGAGEAMPGPRTPGGAGSAMPGMPTVPPGAGQTMNARRGGIVSFQNGGGLSPSDWLDEKLPWMSSEASATEDIWKRLLTAAVPMAGVYSGGKYAADALERAARQGKVRPALSKAARLGGRGLGLASLLELVSPEPLGGDIPKLLRMEHRRASGGIVGLQNGGSPEQEYEWEWGGDLADPEGSYGTGERSVPGDIMRWFNRRVADLEGLGARARHIGRQAVEGAWPGQHYVGEERGPDGKLLAKVPRHMGLSWAYVDPETEGWSGRKVRVPVGDIAEEEEVPTPLRRPPRSMYQDLFDEIDEASALATTPTTSETALAKVNADYLKDLSPDSAAWKSLSDVLGRTGDPRKDQGFGQIADTIRAVKDKRHAVESQDLIRQAGIERRGDPYTRLKLGARASEVEAKEAIQQLLARGQSGQSYFSPENFGKVVEILQDPMRNETYGEEFIEYLETMLRSAMMGQPGGGSRVINRLSGGVPPAGGSL